MIYHPGAQPDSYVPTLITCEVDWFCLADVGRFWKAPKSPCHPNYLPLMPIPALSAYAAPRTNP